MTSSALPASDFSVPDFSGRSDSHVCLILMLSRICGFQGAFSKNHAFFIFFNSGSHLPSRTVSSAVLSAGQVLTVVFGMGTGVTPDRIAARFFSP